VRCRALYLAEGLAWQARHKGSATDVRLDTWWRPSGQWATRLTHVTLAAVPAVPWLIVGAEGTTSALVFGILLFVVAVSAVFNIRPRRLSFREIATRRGILRLAIGLVPGLAFGT
jgi:hypothetical protein